jgi:ABC-type Fe3+ transport system substrate-binding protein
MGILKGSKRPNAAKLFMEFLLSEEGMQAFVTGEGVFSLREGFQVPAAVKKYTPDIATVKPMLVNWGTFTIPEVRKVQDQFRKILRVD